LERREEALRAFETILGQDPEHEAALMYAAALSASRGQPQAAAGYWRRAIAVDPWSSQYHFGLAQAHADVREWTSAADACRAALERNPSSLESRKLLISCLVRQGDRIRAREEFDRLLPLFDKNDRDILRQWLEQLR